MATLKKFVQNSFVQKCFLSLFIFVLVLFSCFLYFTRNASNKALLQEYTAYSELQTNRLTVTLDDDFKSLSRVTSLLHINEQINIYLFNENYEDIFPSLYSQIHSYLLSYKEGFPAVDSIYLFPCYGDQIISTSNLLPAPINTVIDDQNCLKLSEAPDRITFVPRKKNNLFPYLMTIYLPVYKSEQKAMIVLNINMNQLAALKKEAQNSFQCIYIISDSGELLYRNHQNDMPESLDVVPELTHFDPAKTSFSRYVESENPYIYVQEHSSRYDWYYVTITEPQNYIDKGYDLYSSMLSLLPWLAALALAIIIWLVWILSHPVRTIMEFLDNPFADFSEQLSSSETQDIIRRFTKYIQANKDLAEELDKQLEQQHKATYQALQLQINPHFLFNTLNLIRNSEIEALGFDHKTPEMTLSLSKLLQYSLDSATLVPLRTEFYYLTLYLKILDQRYNNMINYDLQINDNAKEFLIPKLVLQPLIENAVFHGLSSALDRHNMLVVKAEMQNAFCRIVIQDNGIGMSPETLQELRNKIAQQDSLPANSIGFQNVVLRLYLTYGKTFQLEIDSTPNEGTRLILLIPA